MEKSHALPEAGQGIFPNLPRSYSSTGAPTGQVPAQAPQLMQVSASMTYLPSPSEIAFTGHSAAQAPQLMHSSVILNAMLFHLHVHIRRSSLRSYSIIPRGKKQAKLLRRRRQIPASPPPRRPSRQEGVGPSCGPLSPRGAGRCSLGWVRPPFPPPWRGGRREGLRPSPPAGLSPPPWARGSPDFAPCCWPPCWPVPAWRSWHCRPVPAISPMSPTPRWPARRTPCMPWE